MNPAEVSGKIANVPTGAERDRKFMIGGIHQFDEGRGVSG
jgi:hypothetical protein